MLKEPQILSSMNQTKLKSVETFYVAITVAFHVHSKHVEECPERQEAQKQACREDVLREGLTSSGSKLASWKPGTGAYSRLKMDVNRSISYCPTRDMNCLCITKQPVTQSSIVLVTSCLPSLSSC